jgi:Cu/Ag efflux protein CusF
MKTIRIVSALALLFAVSAHAQNAVTPAQPAVSAGAKSTLPLVEGEIRKLDPATGLIVLKHGEIPNMGMPAMTMGFYPADPKMLAGLKVGDKVRFQAQMIGGKATVTELRPNR